MAKRSPSKRSCPLDASEILQFYESGYIRPGRVLDEEEVSTLYSLISDASVRERSEGRRYDLLDPCLWPDTGDPPPPEEESVDFLFNLWLEYPDIRCFVFNSTLALWASQLLGTTAVRLLEDNAVDKAPMSGGDLKWHQDFPYWPLAQPNALTAWIALDAADGENGAMRVAPGSHLTGERLPVVFSSGTPYLAEKRPAVVKPIDSPEAQGFDVETVSLGPGEVSMHSSLLWHASGPNNSPRPRRALIIRYVADGTIWLGSQRYEYNYSDEEVGIDAGKQIGGKYFPLIPFSGDA